MEIFASLDDTLIDRCFQPVVDWIAQHLLSDCFQQARVCTNISAVLWIWSQIDDVTSAARLGSTGLQVFQTSLLLVGLGGILVLHTLFQRVGGVGGQGRANPLRAGMYMHRLTLLLALGVNTAKSMAGSGSVALLTLGIFTTTAVYIGACSNPPPAKHKRSEAGWVGRLSAHPS